MIKKFLLFVLCLGIGFLILSNTTKAEVIFYENFDNYASGTSLDSISGFGNSCINYPTTCKTINTYSYSSPNSAIMDGGKEIITTGINTGTSTVSFWAKDTSSSAAIIQFEDSSYQHVCAVVFQGFSASITIESETSADATSIGSSSGNFDLIEVEINTDNNICRGRVNGGGWSTVYGTNSIDHIGFTNAGIAGLYVDNFFVGNETSVTPEEYDNTSFIVTDPINNEIISTPYHTFTSTLYITEQDQDRMLSIWGIFDGFIRVQAVLSDPVSDAWSCQIYTEDFQPEDIELLSDTIDIEFDYTFDGNNTNCPYAIYDKDYKISWTSAGSKTQFTGGVQWTTATSTYFTIGSTVNEGNLIQYVASSTRSRLNENYFDKFDASACNPISGEFDITDCILLLFWPNTNRIREEMGITVQELGASFPLGYITDFLSIISTSTVGTLTPINATIPQGLPGAGETLTLDITNKLDPLLNATTGQFITSTENDTRTFYEITNDYWEIIVYVSAMLYILSRVLGQSFDVSFFGAGQLERATGGRSRIIGIKGKARKGSNADLGTQGLIRDKDGIIRKRTF